jgi:hypothetical protein
LDLGLSNAGDRPIEAGVVELDLSSTRNVHVPVGGGTLEPRPLALET